MKDFSSVQIEIDEQNYTLFLNRKGIVAWEKFCKEENEKLAGLKGKYDSLIYVEDNVELNDDTNPFDGLEEIDDFDSDLELISKTFRRLYWIMLYTEHKLSVNQANELYDKAILEYGEEQLIELGRQMIEDTNMDKVSKNKENLKNLTALRPTK